MKIMTFLIIGTFLKTQEKEVKSFHRQIRFEYSLNKRNRFTYS